MRASRRRPASAVTNLPARTNLRASDLSASNACAAGAPHRSMTPGLQAAFQMPAVEAVLAAAPVALRSSAASDDETDGGESASARPLLLYFPNRKNPRFRYSRESLFARPNHD